MKTWQAALISTGMVALLAVSLWVRSKLTIDPLWGFLDSDNFWLRLYAVLQLIAFACLFTAVVLYYRWLKRQEAV